MPCISTKRDDSDRDEGKECSEVSICLDCNRLESEGALLRFGAELEDRLNKLREPPTLMDFFGVVGLDDTEGADDIDDLDVGPALVDGLCGRVTPCASGDDVVGFPELDGRFQADGG